MSRFVRLTTAATKMDRTLKVTRQSSAGLIRTYGTRLPRSQFIRKAILGAGASCWATVTVMEPSGLPCRRRRRTPARIPVMLGLEAADSGVQRRESRRLIASLEHDAVEGVEQRLADLVPFRHEGQEPGVLQLGRVDLHHRVARQSGVRQCCLRRRKLVGGL